MSTHIFGSEPSGPTRNIGLWCTGARELVGLRKVVAYARLVLGFAFRSPPNNELPWNSTDTCGACGTLPGLLAFCAPAAREAYPVPVPAADPQASLGTALGLSDTMCPPGSRGRCRGEGEEEMLTSTPSARGLANFRLKASEVPIGMRSNSICRGAFGATTIRPCDRGIAGTRRAT